ncbi:unnamed protein product [Blepharisma stoltei]|uniref:Uncharacterized protein n=1 Tax=Blepharisma stoltei TaxID=1481888 RepID=A0AAU9IAQ5_9CILI|nr:unnamed protein product [Blepharisma stoltei]
MDPSPNNELVQLAPLKLPPRPGSLGSKASRINIRSATHSSFTQRSSANSQSLSPSACLTSLSSNSSEGSFEPSSSQDEQIIPKSKRGTVRIQSLKLNKNCKTKSDSEDRVSDENNTDIFAEPLPNRMNSCEVFYNASDLRNSMNGFRRPKSQKLAISKSGSDLKEISGNRLRSSMGVVVKIREAHHRMTNFQNVNMIRPSLDSIKPPLPSASKLKAKTPECPFSKSSADWF